MVGDEGDVGGATGSLMECCFSLSIDDNSLLCCCFSLDSFSIDGVYEGVAAASFELECAIV